MGNMKYTKDYEDLIAKGLEDLTGYKTRVFPPMGMRASILIAVDGDDGELKGVITLTCKDGEIHYDTGKVLIKYPQGTIGELNGFGNETKPLPDSIDEIWNIIKDKHENQ